MFLIKLGFWTFVFWSAGSVETAGQDQDGAKPSVIRPICCSSDQTQQEIYQ